MLTKYVSFNFTSCVSWIQAPGTPNRTGSNRVRLINTLQRLIFSFIRLDSFVRNGTGRTCQRRGSDVLIGFYSVIGPVTFWHFLTCTQCTYNLTLSRVHETTVAWKSNRYYIFLCVCVYACVNAYVCVCGVGKRAPVCACAYSLTYPACNAHPPYCHLRLRWLYHIFRHYLINDTIIFHSYYMSCPSKPGYRNFCSQIEVCLAPGII
jgi:hypothetical protein